MIHRNICCSLLEISYRITSGLHKFLDQNVRVSSRLRRFVYKPRLCLLPSICKARLLLRRERANLQATHALFTRGQFRLRFSFGAELADSALVLSAELFSQDRRAPPFEEK